MNYTLCLCLFMSRCEGEDNQKFLSRRSLQLYLSAPQQRRQHAVPWSQGDPLRSQPHWYQCSQATEKCKSQASVNRSIVCCININIVRIKSQRYIMNMFVDMIWSQKYNENITHLPVLYLQYESDSVSLLQITWKTPEKKRDECSFKGKDLQASELLV